MPEEVPAVGCPSALPSKPNNYIYRSDTKPLKGSCIKKRSSQKDYIANAPA
jgi:hypothetical protein